MITEIQPNVFVHYWDWKEQPNWAEILRSLNKIQAYGEIVITEIDTGNDEEAIVITTNRKITKAQAKKYWDEFCNQ